MITTMQVQGSEADQSAARRVARVLVLPVVLIAVASAVVLLWQVWLGWDTQNNREPDGSLSEPYESWQIQGFVLTVAACAVLAGAAIGIQEMSLLVGVVASGALGVVTFRAWSSESSGLFVVAVAICMVGAFVGTWIAAALGAAVRSRLRRLRTYPSA